MSEQFDVALPAPIAPVTRIQAPSPFVTIRKRFFIGALTNASTILYTAPAAPVIANSVNLNPKSIIRQLNICNTDSVDRTFTLYLVESGGSIGANRALFSAATIIAGQTLTYDNLEFTLEASDTLRGLASVTAVVTVYVGGDELSS